MDEIDRHLLEEVQRDADRSLRDIGEVVGLSAASVQRRLARLRRSGVIRATVCVVDPTRVGSPLTVVTLVSMANDGPQQTGPLVERLRGLVEVREIHELVGERDLAIVSTTADLDTYAASVAAVLDDDPNVHRFESHVSLRTHHTTTAVPIRNVDGGI